MCGFEANAFQVYGRRTRCTKSSEASSWIESASGYLWADRAGLTIVEAVQESIPCAIPHEVRAMMG
jgi:hypothetical protein